MLYQDQKPIARIAKDCGMDAKTIALASKGEMTNRTLQRFDRWFTGLDKGIENPRIPENNTILPLKTNKEKVINQVIKMLIELQRYDRPDKLTKKELEDMTVEELQFQFFRTESKLKYYLIKKYQDLIKRYHIWLYDKWDYWQWKEKLDLTLKDIPK
jgi:hypothetical protein